MTEELVTLELVAIDNEFVCVKAVRVGSLPKNQAMLLIDLIKELLEPKMDGL